MAKSAEEAFAGFSREETLIIRWRLAWRRQARDKQLAPDLRDPVKWAKWKSWGSLTGRGTGKTLSYANWIGQEAALTPQTLCAVVAPTHHYVRYTCCTGDTLVLTRSGEIRIVDVRAGDEVLTRAGWRQVIASGLSGSKSVLRISVVGARDLRITPDHLVWNESERKFRPASELRPGDAVSVCRSSSSTGTSFGVTQTLRSEITDSISVVGIKAS